MRSSNWIVSLNKDEKKSYFNPPPRSYIRLFLGVGFPLHKQYPYSLYHGEDSSSLVTWLYQNQRGKQQAPQTLVVKNAGKMVSFFLGAFRKTSQTKTWVLMEFKSNVCFYFLEGRG